MLWSRKTAPVPQPRAGRGDKRQRESLSSSHEGPVQSRLLHPLPTCQNEGYPRVITSPNQTLIIVNARLPKGNLAAGNAGGADGYRGVEPEFRRRPKKAVVRPVASPLRDGRFAASSGSGVRERDAPDAVVVPRHRVSPSASPMTGSSGVSSTPRLIGSITTPSGILDHPLQWAIAHKADDDD